MTLLGIDVPQQPEPRIAQVSLDRPWMWLLAGLRDLMAAPVLGLSYGLALTAIGWLAGALLMLFDLPYLLLPLTAGFFFAGPFVAVGTLIGAVLALFVFAIGALSIPYLLDRPRAKVVEAIAVSVTGLRRNPKPMLLWAGLIAILVVHALIPAFFGLIIVLPIVAHATWHAYRDIVRFDDR